MVLVKVAVRGVLLIWLRVGQGSTALTVGAGVFFFFGDFFSRLSFLFSPSLWEAARYRLKKLSQRAVRPKTSIQATMYC